MSDLDRRAALAMGLLKAHHEHGWIDPYASADAEGVWSPTTDANACRELLEEVKRRGLEKQFERQLNIKRGGWTIDVMLIPLTARVQAAVEVLEAAAPPTKG